MRAAAAGSARPRKKLRPPSLPEAPAASLKTKLAKLGGRLLWDGVVLLPRGD